MSWKFNWRKKIKIGPFFAWLTPTGFSSHGVQVGRWTRNVTRGTDTFDTPGRGSVTRRRRRRR